MSGIVSFLESPLVTWIKAFGDDEPVAFQDFCDGIFFNDVLLQIDQREVEECEKINRNPSDQNARLQNWNILLKNIKSFYHDVLQQTVVTTNPNVFALVEDPSKECCLEDMEKIMLLLLGCAVQCDQKAYHIDRIMCLEISTQQAIVQWIRQVTDTPDHVVSPDMISADSDIAKQIYVVLKRVVKERDDHFENCIMLKQERNYYNHELEKKRGSIAPPPSLEKYHLAKELQDYKNQLATVTEDLEEKGKMISDLKDDVGNKTKELAKIKIENMALNKDAKLARKYRDELDSFKEQVLKVEKYEKELNKYKEKIHEMEYFKTRVEELKEDNAVLNEAKQQLECQHSEALKRADTVTKDFMQLQYKMEDLKQEKERQGKKLEEALEENAALEFERTRDKEGYSGPLRRMISYTSAEFLHGSNLQLSGHPISEELSDSMHSHVTKLEIENDQLKKELEEIKTKLHDTQVQLETVILQSEKDYQKRKHEFEKEQNHLKLKITQDVTDHLQRSCDSKVKDVQEATRIEKIQIVQDYDAKLRHMEKENKDLRQRLDETEVASMKEKEGRLLEQGNLMKEVASSYENQIKSLRLKNDELSKRLEQTSLQINEDVVKEKEENQTNVNLGLQAKLIEQKRQIENGLQVKVHHLQREKEDLHVELDALQDELSIERDKYEHLMFDYQRLDQERLELKENVDAIRECSENHIKSLEQELENLQTKAVAMENLNDYLSNLSTTDENIFLQNDEKYSDENHNNHDISRESLRSLPADLSKIAVPDRGNRSEKHNSICSEAGTEHDYAEIASLSRSYSKAHRGEKINYVKGTTFKDKYKQDIGKTSGILGKLKSYVKPQKESESDPKLRRTREDTSSRIREKPAFDRNSKHRHTIQNIHMKESGPHFKPSKLKTPIVQSHSRPVQHAFSRDHALRKTMPERRTVYRFPEKRSSHSRNSSQNSLLSQEAQRLHGENMPEHRQSRRVKSGYVDTSFHEISVDDEDLNEVKIPPNPYHAHCDLNDGCVSEFDSGFTQSTENSPPNKVDDNESFLSSKGSNNHKLTSIEILSTETIKKRFTSTPNNVLVQQIVKLQDENISLSTENTELRKSMDMLKFTDGSDETLMKKYARLEAENRKLKMIIETLQYTLSGKNPYDNTEYHYFTNV